MLLLTLAGAAWLLVPFWQLAGHFADAPAREPSRLYGSPTVLTAGGLWAAEAVLEELEGEGYRAYAGDGPLPAGRFRRTTGKLEVHLSRLPGGVGGELLAVSHRGRRVEDLTVGGREVSSAALPPPLLASYYGDDLQERRSVAVDELPEELVEAVLAAEDDGFFEHTGLSASGILRAAWVNLRGGEIRQGGSTLTQQLVKNLYLSHERTWGRKLQEMVLALLLEMRYDKREILEAYLNEIYLGASNGVSLIGVGPAARVYFSKEVGQLDLAESATLAGMIRSPANTSPAGHPERAKERRDWVLGRLAELGWVEPERVEGAMARPLAMRATPVIRRRAPYFAEAAAEEAARRFGIEELADAGYTLYSTVRWSHQQQAQEAVSWGVSALEKGWQKGARVNGPLQAALVSVDAETGGILAYVGGRDYALSQFDRAGRARRQAGSAFKPVVFAAAFEEEVASPASFLEDAPLTLRLAGQRWSPQNADGEYHGWVTARTALEKSLNTATARLALQVGLEEIVDLARQLGVSAPLEPLPALSLGAFELTPLELTTVYATFAAGGIRPPVHGLEGVYDPQGRPVEGRPLPEPERVISPQTAYLLTSVLQGVLDRGTAASVRRQGLADPLAGKTGTTNDRRDSWFAGYSPRISTAVWVGYDDNSPTRLSGARAALPLWARYTAATRPPEGFSTFPQPPGVVTAVIDPASGLLATERCSTVITETFLEGTVPDRVCRLHGGFFVEPAEQPEGVEEHRKKRRHPFRRWLKRVFGDGE